MHAYIIPTYISADWHVNLSRITGKKNLFLVWPGALWCLPGTELKTRTEETKLKITEESLIRKAKIKKSGTTNCWKGREH